MEHVIILNNTTSLEDPPLHKKMNMNDNQDSYQVLPTTPTSIILINIERYGGRVCSEVYNADFQCECVPCEMDGAKSFLECNYTSCAKFVHHVCSIKVYESEDGYWSDKEYLN